MTRSTTSATGTKTIAKAEYLNLIAYSRKFSAEDIFFSSAGLDYPDLYEAAVNLLENGETAWDTPEFEECLYQVFCGWAKEGRLERLELTANWLARTTEGDRPPSREFSAIAGAETEGDAQIVREIAIALTKAGQVERALQLTATIPNAGDNAEALSDVATTLADSGQFDRALAVANSFADARTQARALTAIAEKKEPEI